MFIPVLNTLLGCVYQGRRYIHWGFLHNFCCHRHSDWGYLQWSGGCEFKIDVCLIL